MEVNKNPEINGCLFYIGWWYELLLDCSKDGFKETEWVIYDFKWCEAISKWKKYDNPDTKVLEEHEMRKNYIQLYCKGYNMIR